MWTSHIVKRFSEGMSYQIMEFKTAASPIHAEHDTGSRLERTRDFLPKGFLDVKHTCNQAHTLADHAEDA